MRVFASRRDSNGEASYICAEISRSELVDALHKAGIAPAGMDLENVSFRRDLVTIELVRSARETGVEQ